MALLSRLSQSRPLYEAFKSLKEGAQWDSLPEARRRIVEHELRDFVLGGVALEVTHRGLRAYGPQERAVGREGATSYHVA